VILNFDCLVGLKELAENSVDLLITDPPYGISFMGKEWDKALPDIKVWQECLRVLKPGAFAFVMSIPRADCLSRMIISLEDAGFRVNFTPIFWAYASGFPKAQNISKAVDKRLGVERDKGKLRTDGRGKWDLKMNRESGDTGIGHADGSKQTYTEEYATSSQAKALDGSYGGFQPKPAVEVIIVAMKPLSEKTFVAQALKNGKGITWLDDCRIPYESEEVDFTKVQDERIYGDGNCIGKGEQKETTPLFKQSGRFPANLLVSDDVLNDGRVTRSQAGDPNKEESHTDTYGWAKGGIYKSGEHYADSGSFSRYFDLDKWCQFLIVPKASKSEKNKGCEDLPQSIVSGETNEFGKMGINTPEMREKRGVTTELPRYGNPHPTVKPLKLMSYLITLGSREGDTVLDPFMGSGTTGIACEMLGRKFIGYEIDKSYFEIAKKRIGVKNARSNW